MNVPRQDTWREANQRYLMSALATVRTALERHAASDRDEIRPESGTEPAQALQAVAGDMPAPPALETLCAAFGLTGFERDVLLMCAGVELDSTFAACCAAARSDPQSAHPTFGLALAALPEAHWSTLTPAAPLRYWRLVEVGNGGAFTSSPLRIDERVLHYLAGVSHLDERLHGLVEPVIAPDELPPSQRAVAHEISGLWSRTEVGSPGPGIQLRGDDPAGKRAVAAAASAALGLQLYAIHAADVPVAAIEREALARLWEREAILSGSALLLDCHDDANGLRAALSLLERVQGFCIVAGADLPRTRGRTLVRLDVNKPGASEQRALWRDALGPLAHELNGQIEALSRQFDLGTQGIQAASAGMLEGMSRQETPGDLLWDACRAQARSGLDDLAQRIEPAATWDELVLPKPQRETLREISSHVRQRAKVYETWGFAARSARGLGISALFAGASGTGKTMAAEVLAGELRLDLYRIDLSQVVSKYIGETEKNLRRVFDAAETGGAILLFDEADALFGKRSEVKDSHDRYANIEVSYLLQRMESYRGLAILTTNMKDALDTAFLRRIRFVVQFPFPDAEQRAEIWRRIFPPDTPTENLDPSKLARLNITGGNIRNIALNAAFLAADAEEQVHMKHLLRAARSEYAKLEKPLTEVEIGGWV
jgi:hypothetical protein